MLTGFTTALLLITISELGDKTFCIAMLLAMRHARRWVFIGVSIALAAMTILSVLLGQAVSALPKHFLWSVEVVLFIAFGLKVLYDAYLMPRGATCDEMNAAQATIAESATPSGLGYVCGVILQAFMLTFVAEWGDRTQFATIALAASNNPWAVTAGASLGHMLCAAIAVAGGRLVAGRISERLITAIGGALFVLFGVLAAVQGK